MKHTIAAIDNQICFPRLIHKSKEKNISAMMSAAINQDALPVSIFAAISIQLISL
jgi:hypothetical protein